MPVKVEISKIQSDLTEALALVSYFYHLEKNTHRAQAYETAAKHIKSHPHEITSGRQAREEIKGVGESIAEDIDFFLKKGQIPRLLALQEKYRERIEVVDKFTEIYGVGTVKANHYYDQGYRSLEDLYYGKKDQNLPPVLTSASRMSVPYLRHFAQRISRPEMDMIGDDIRELLPSQIEWEIAGSYRRGEADSGDIDVLVKRTDQEGGRVDLSKLVEYLRPILVGDLAQGEVFYMGIVRLLPHSSFNAHRIDILMVPNENWGPALLHFTGSREFNILMRQRAKELGWSLNEKKLADRDGAALRVESEEEAFALLGVKFLPPPERTRELVALRLLD